MSLRNARNVRRAVKRALVLGTVGAAFVATSSAVAAPTAVTGPYSNLQPTSVTVTGSVDPDGSATTCAFEWGSTDFGYGNVVPCAGDIGSGSEPVDVSAYIDGLDAGASFVYRIRASSGAETVYGDPVVVLVNFELAPLATTGPASGISAAAATLTGSVNPNYSPTSCEFRYGADAADLGLAAPCEATPGSGGAAVPVEAAVDGLEAGTTYHYKLVATNSAGTGEGERSVFATDAAQPPGSNPPPSDPPVDPGATVPVTDSSTIVVRKRALVRGGRARLQLACRGSAGTTCTGTLRLLARSSASRPRRARLVGRARYALLAKNGFSTVRIRLTSVGRRMVSHRRGTIVSVRGPGLAGVVRLTRNTR